MNGKLDGVWNVNELIFLHFIYFYPVAIKEPVEFNLFFCGDIMSDTEVVDIKRRGRPSGSGGGDSKVI